MTARTEYIITIDGPSGVGKSTVARALARDLGFLYLDTGAMYRAVTLAAVECGLEMDPIDQNAIASLLSRMRLELDEEGCIHLNGAPVEPRIRDESITRNVSAVASLPCVRSHLVDLQRGFAALGSLVVEGRDTGSVVFPDAQYKFYLDADPAERALRRARQTKQERGKDLSRKDVLEDQARRDEIDSQRALSPLTLTKDMIVIETTRLDLSGVVEKMLGYIRGAAS